MLDFSTGSIVLPLRITCYCRHHREKVGFLVNMQMLDHAGRVVAFGQTKPIMITDDHKTAALHSRNADYAGDTNWPQLASSSYKASGIDGRNPGRRAKKDLGAGKRRPKPYDTTSKPTRPSREGSTSSLPSPSTPYSQLPGTRSPTPSNLFSQFLTPDTLTSMRGTAAASSCSSPDHSTPGLNQDLGMFPTDNTGHMQQGPYVPEIAQMTLPLASTVDQPNLVIPHPHPMFFESTGVTRPTPGHAPTIHRLIPNMGPTHGGIEVTVLGSNFHATDLTCMFGGVPASSTQRWSDNTLVCILPPRSTPGVVAVWIDKHQEEQASAVTCLFTYSDESDRTL